jgi:hypothetical protein
MDHEIYIVALRPAPDAGLLRLDDAAVLEEAAAGGSLEADWTPSSAGVSGDVRTDFLRVDGYPAMLAFREELSATTGLEFYLEGGEFLPAETPQGRFLLWHLLTGQVINCLNKGSVDPDGIVRQPSFLPHRLPGSCAVFSTPECYSSQLFLQAQLTELPPSLGGPDDGGKPPAHLRPDDWRSLLLEYSWRGWTGLEFEIVWRSGPDEIRP